MDKVAIVGKPNVGKSSLFNRLSRNLDAITSEVSGTTRDIKQKEIKLWEKSCFLIDTGGIDDKDELFLEIQSRSIEAAKNSDLILYLVDGKKYPDDEDKNLYYSLQKYNSNIILVVNKIDNDKGLEIVWEYEKFGIENIFAISVSHNRGITPLIEFIESKISDDTKKIDAIEKSNVINIGIIGKVNVGKSSMLNTLTDSTRSVVSNIAGTTIDPVDETCNYKDFIFKFVDTAGIRRRGKIDGIEKHALNRTQKILEASDIALLILDGSTDIAELDEKIAGLVDKFGLGTIIVINKWDIKQDNYKKIVDEIRFRFKFLSFAPIITVSANSGRNIEKLKDLIIKVYKNFTTRVPTSKINDLILEAQKRHQIPSYKGKLIKIYYATQFDIKPPKISVIMNKPEGLHFSYKRYLINFIRQNYDFEGVPIRVIPKSKKQTQTKGDQEIEIY